MENIPTMTKRPVCLVSVLVIIAIIAAVLPACQSKDAGQTELVVFAAASLTDAFTDLGETFEKQDPNITVSFNFGSSSALAIQLSEGAKADVFASANPAQMDKAIQDGRISEAPVTFATNRLVIITPVDNPAGIQAPVDLSQGGVKLVLAAPDVPARDYSEEMLGKLAADSTYGDGFKAAVLANLVSEETNVRQVVTKVSLGEADAGIVYSSDVTPDVSGTLFRIEVPDALNVLASCPMAIVHDASNPEGAQSFIDFVLSQGGQTILQKWGFGPAPIE